MGQLLIFSNNKKIVNGQKNRSFFNYYFNSEIPLCKNTYLKLVSILDITLKAINNHLIIEGLAERQHENMKNLPKVAS